jgi:hypothetical protein
MGTMVIGVRLVMPTTRKPINTLHKPILLIIDQHVSKYIGGGQADDIAI